MYFKIFKLKSWGKRPAERRSRLIQRFLKFLSGIKQQAGANKSVCSCFFASGWRARPTSVLGGVSTIRSTALRLRFFMAAPPVLAVRCWDGISELRRNSEASAQLLEASEVPTKITALGRLSVISMRRSAEIMQQRRTAVAAVKSGVAPQRISNISEIKTVGFPRKTYRFCVIARPHCGRGNLKV